MDMDMETDMAFHKLVQGIWGGACEEVEWARAPFEVSFGFI